MEISKEKFEEFTRKLKEPELLSDYREKSFLKLRHASFPPFRYGLNILIEPLEFDFSSLHPKKKSEKNKPIAHSKNVKVYCNEELESAEDSLKPFLSDGWKDNEDENKLFYFNNAFFNDILFIRVPENMELREPIVIDYDIKEGPLVSAVFIELGKNSKAKFLFNKSSQTEKNCYVSDDIRILAHENSRVDFVSIQQLQPDIVNVQRRFSRGKKDSSINWIDACMGAKYNRMKVTSSLEGDGSSATATVLFLASSRQRYDILTTSLHQAPRTFSNILTKGVLNHEAKALSRGLIRIYENASGSNGYEKQDALLLSEKAEADAIPNLEIHNHDVRCTHGSTTGQIDADKLFYLMSRGLNREEATFKIVEGYFAPVIEQFDSVVRGKVQEAIIEALKWNGKNTNQG